MSKAFTFRLVDEAEDGALRAVLRQSSMPGSISLAFSREPSYFIAEKAGNISSQTLVCQNNAGQIVGIGSRAIRNLYVNGVSEKIGYLSSLRLLPEARNGINLFRGYQFLKSLHDDGQVPYYLTTILDQNIHAQSVLSSARSVIQGSVISRSRACMPAYIPVGKIVTYMIPIRKHASHAMRLMSLINVTGCTAEDIVPMHACLDEWNGHHQFAPAYSLKDICNCVDDSNSGGSEVLINGRSSSFLPNFSSKNIYLCKEADEVMGTLAVWDQNCFKQTIVTGYSLVMKVMRPAYNLVSQMRGSPLLPSKNGEIRLLYGSMISAVANDRDVFESLIEKACVDWSGKGFDYLIIGLAEDNPLSNVARRLSVQQLRSIVYLVYWPEQKSVASHMMLHSDGNIHLELATL